MRGKKRRGKSLASHQLMSSVNSCICDQQRQARPGRRAVRSPPPWASEYGWPEGDMEQAHVAWFINLLFLFSFILFLRIILFKKKKKKTKITARDIHPPPPLGSYLSITDAAREAHTPTYTCFAFPCRRQFPGTSDQSQSARLF